MTLYSAYNVEVSLYATNVKVENIYTCEHISFRIRSDVA